jgi:hypothetical protein
MKNPDNSQQRVTSATVSGTPSKRDVSTQKAARSGALGNTAKSVDQPKRDVAARERRGKAFSLQRTAAKLLPQERVGLCKWAVVSKLAGVDVRLTTYESGAVCANFGGLQTCGSVWLCPCCGRRISETRRGELNQLLAWARQHGLRPVMVTLTARHGIRDNLKGQIDAMKKAKQRLRQRREWRRIKGRIAGTVTATEVTYGSNGWHTHFHEILLIEPTAAERAKEAAIRAALALLPKGSEKNAAFDVEADRVEGEALAVLDGLSRVWRTCLTGVGLSGGRAAWHAQGAAAAGAYVAKWGAGEELTLSGTKAATGKGRTPLQLLADAEAGDQPAGQLWQTYGLAFKGRRQLVWSPGLKDIAGIGETTDEEAAGDADQEDADDVAPFLHIEHDEWTGHEGWRGARYRRARLLDAAEMGGVSAARGVIEDGGIDVRPERVELIERIDAPAQTISRPPMSALAAAALAAVRPPAGRGP